MKDYNFSEVEQEKIIEQAISQKNESIKLIDKSEIYYEKDRINYKKIIDATDMDEAMEMYWDMDTAAREEFMNTLVGRKEESLDEEISEIIHKWYFDGFATWSGRGAPGEDGMFGGSLHCHEITYNIIVIDFGSADKEKAMTELNERLKAKGYIAKSIYTESIHDRLVVIKND